MYYEINYRIILYRLQEEALEGVLRTFEWMASDIKAAPVPLFWPKDMKDNQNTMYIDWLSFISVIMDLQVS